VDILRHFARAGAAVFGLLILALRPDTGLAASAAEIEIKTDATIKQFVETVDGAQVFLENAKGVLVFPSIVRAGFVFGGQYGEGALRIGGRTVDYYNSIGGSFGFQLGVQTQSLILVFLEQGALDRFRNSHGWEVGVDGSVALVELGGARSLGTITGKNPIVGFIFDNRGLMFNLTLEGTKFSKVDKTGTAGDRAAGEPATPTTTPEQAPAPPAQPAEDRDEEEDGIILRRP
jgi:lipid-binding SYLF domain-containing protein